MSSHTRADGGKGIRNLFTYVRPNILTEKTGISYQILRLASFGGAGGQHACEIASLLGIKTILIHRYSSILSAYGLALADRYVTSLSTHY